MIESAILSDRIAIPIDRNGLPTNQIADRFVRLTYQFCQPYFQIVVELLYYSNASLRFYSSGDRSCLNLALNIDLDRLFY